MSSIGLQLIENVMSTFTSDTFGRPNTREIREQEFKDCDLTFECGFKTITPEQLKECYRRKIYQNSFSIKADNDYKMHRMKFVAN